jgi:hypothetical protein
VIFRNAKRNGRRKEKVNVRRVGKKAGEKINVRME